MDELLVEDAPETAAEEADEAVTDWFDLPEHDWPNRREAGIKE